MSPIQSGPAWPPLYRPAAIHSKKGSPLRAYLRATSSFNLTPRPGFSGRDKSVLDNGLRHSFDQIIPEGNIRSMEFEHEKIRDGSAEMRGSQSSDWTTDVVRRNRNCLSVRKMRDVARHHQAPDLLQVWGNDSHSMRLQNLS